MTSGMFYGLPLNIKVNYTHFMGKPAAKPKSARETLVESINRIREEARQSMSEERFREIEEKVHELANKVRASRGRRRETA
jgi:hypothetical protein